MKEITLTNSDKKTIVDDEDFERLNVYSWRLSHAGYCEHKRKRKPHSLRINRFILGYEGNLDVHHINGDRLDNRKTNLKIIPRSDHSTQHAPTRRRRPVGIGVTYNKKAGLWKAYVWSDRKIVWVPKYFRTKDAALTARLEWIKKNPLILISPIPKN